MTRRADHGWVTAPTPGYGWTHLDDDVHGPLQEVLEPLSGYPWSGQSAERPEIWSIRVVQAGGAHWHVLTSTGPIDDLDDGRPLRLARHLIVDVPEGGSVPGQLLNRLPTGVFATRTDRRPNESPVDWASCGGDWSATLAQSLGGGHPIHVIFPDTHRAQDWWLAIEAHLGRAAWRLTVLLECMPDESGADAVIAVDGSPCAEAMRASGRTLLDLARVPAAPNGQNEAGADAGDVGDASDDQYLGPIADVELAPGGPPMGLAALGLLTLLMLGSAVAVVIWALNTGAATS